MSDVILKQLRVQISVTQQIFIKSPLHTPRTVLGACNVSVNKIDPLGGSVRRQSLKDTSKEQML
jgi:hypothetical protein